jgi:D-tyrosyl-tRNA(Tyr) deacylase
MKIVIQRVTSASILINSEIKRTTLSETTSTRTRESSISEGIVVYFGVGKEDTPELVDYFVNKLLTLRLWSDDENKGLQRNIEDIQGDILIVSQFTLYGDCTKGTKPKFNYAMNPEDARKIYDVFVKKLKDKSNIRVETGEFGAMMEITQVNNGPMTMIVER